MDENGESTNYSQEMLVSYFQETDEDFDLLFDDEESAQAAIDEYVATLGISEDDTVYESCQMTIQPQASMVIMEQSTGNVVAMIGGRGEKSASRTLNRASDTLRQPGSTFKILAAYAPAFEELGYATARSLIRKTGRSDAWSEMSAAITAAGLRSGKRLPVRSTWWQLRPSRM